MRHARGLELAPGHLGVLTIGSSLEVGVSTLETCRNCDDLLRMAREEKIETSEEDVDRLLLSNEVLRGGLIPRFFQPYVLIAPDTVLHLPFDSRFVVCMYYARGHWRKGFVWVDGGGRDRLVSCLNYKERGV